MQVIVNLLCSSGDYVGFKFVKKHEDNTWKYLSNLSASQLLQAEAKYLFANHLILNHSHFLILYLTLLQLFVFNSDM